MPCRAGCAPRPVPVTNFAKPTTRTGHVDRNDVDFVLVFYSQDGRAPMGRLSAGEMRRRVYIRIRNEDVDVWVWVGVGVGVGVEFRAT